jgi:hypothetical protein
MRKWQNKLNNESKNNKITTNLLNNRTGNTVEMTITNVLTQHTVVIAIKINVHETITNDHPKEIAPTPAGAVRAAQAITTEKAHHIRISQQHPTSRSTTEIQQLCAT